MTDAGGPGVPCRSLPGILGRKPRPGRRRRVPPDSPVRVPAPARRPDHAPAVCRRPQRAGRTRTANAARGLSTVSRRTSASDSPAARRAGTKSAISVS